MVVLCFLDMIAQSQIRFEADRFAVQALTNNFLHLRLIFAAEAAPLMVFEAIAA
jgi:hypothetical protein